jgi:hypothetical protein
MTPGTRRVDSPFPGFAIAWSADSANKAREPILASKPRVEASKRTLTIETTDQPTLVEIRGHVLAWQRRDHGLHLGIVNADEEVFLLRLDSKEDSIGLEMLEPGDRLVGLSSRAADSLASVEFAFEMAVHADAHPSSSCSFLIDMARGDGANGEILCFVWRQPDDSG